MLLSIFRPLFDINKKAVRQRSNCPAVLEEWIYVFVDEVVMKIFVYVLIMNPLLYEKIVNLFELNMETGISFELIKQPFKNFLVFKGRR